MASKCPWRRRVCFTYADLEKRGKTIGTQTDEDGNNPDELAMKRRWVKLAIHG